jgi:hypothetical protein
MVHYTATGRSAGEEGAITDRGRYITVLEGDLVHPYHADGFADKGDPVLIGDNIVGVVCSDSPTAATDLVTVDTEGLWYLNVIGAVSDGTSDGIAKALTAGTPIYFQVTPGSDTYLLSGEQDPAHFRPFGYLLTAVSAHVSTPTLALVKVHNACTHEEGRLHFGSGSTATGNMLLEGDPTLRKNRLIEACLAPATLLQAGEQLHGFNIRVVDNLIATGGEITAGELKVVRDEATDVSVSSMTALKLDTDNKNGGIAPFVRGLDIMMEGAPGTTPAIRSAIHINSSGTAGTKEALLEIDGATVCGGAAADKTGGTKNVALSVYVGGSQYWIQCYSA